MGLQREPKSEAQFSELVSRVSHELRSPLTSIKGFSSTLVKRWDRFSDEQRFQFVETISLDADRMSRIVHEVLDAARLEANRIEFQPERFDVTALVRGIVEDYEGRPEAARLEFVAPGPLFVRTDADRLRRSIENLVENGLKFSTDKRVRVTVGAMDGDVEIAVQDEGVGIEPERVPEVFSGPGPTGQLATPSGSGLGLYITRRLLERQGGAISVVSELGKGSTFTITLPREGRT